MKFINRIELCVYGDYALFTDPVTRTGGEKLTYPVPTYEALKGILESVYWKPQITWIIDRVRVMNRISTFSRGYSPNDYTGGRSIFSLTFLQNPEYQIAAHFVPNGDEDSESNENKHYFSAKRALSRGGRRDIFLGTRSCQAFAEPCAFGSGSGFYDKSGKTELGTMFHSFSYPEKNGGKFYARLWNAFMLDGVIAFPLPCECTMINDITESVTVK